MRIINELDRQQLSQRELARMTGIQRTTVYNITRGVVKEPKLRTVYKIAQVLNLEVDDIVIFED